MTDGMESTAREGMKPRQLIDWFVYQHALVLSGHRILVEPFIHPTAAERLRAMAPAGWSGLIEAAFTPVGNIDVRETSGRMIITADFDDRSMWEDGGVAVFASQRVQITVDVHGSRDQILDFTITPIAYDAGQGPG